MNRSFDHLARFFDAVSSLSFWQRLFWWRRILAQSYPAYEEFKNLTNILARSEIDLEETRRSLDDLTKKSDHAGQMHARLDQELRASLLSQQQENHRLNERLERVGRELADLQQERAAWRQDETSRRNEHEKALATLDAIQSRIVSERKGELDAAEQNRLRRLAEMKDRWSRHEKEVEQLLRAVCRRYSIDYIESVPFKGNPDNTVRIADEFVVFDAKSPGSEDLRNFPQYLKSQAEAVRKYANQESVRKEIFLVIPQDTAGAVTQYCYNMADYTVYAVTPNAVEPILLSLRKLEDYEFVNELSPEDRENICRLIGKFAHVVKRRIQVDNFFQWEFLDVLTRCEAGLPRELMDKVLEFEKSEKMNPPQERRSKQILTKELEEDTRRVEQEAASRMTSFSRGEETPATLPLFEKEIR